MRKVEQVEIIEARDESDLAAKYNKWYRDLVDAREAVPTTKGQPLVILDRQFTVTGTGKTRKLYLVIFYEHMLFTGTEASGDRGKGYDKSGFSAVARRGG